jgi:hypothetical protein
MEPSQQDISFMQEWRTSVNPEFATRRNRARARPIARICSRQMNMVKKSTSVMPDTLLLTIHPYRPQNRGKHGHSIKL